MCVCSSPSCHFSASVMQNIGKFGAEKYFTDHRTANAIQLFSPIKRTFFGVFFFRASRSEGVPQGLLDKYSHLFICISLKWILSSGQKPVCTVKILISEEIPLLQFLLFVFCRLINKSVLGWVLLICKKHTLTRSTNLFSRNHPTYFVFD